MVVYTYLFEAKSIQEYLFSSGKMRDVIIASERLDNLIDSTNTSVLYEVLSSAELPHDLLDANMEDTEGCVHFIRCKGGAFYAYCSDKNNLLALRSAWSLTLLQLFPSLVQCDALVSAEELDDALQQGHQKLAQARNAPTINLPLATAISQRSSRSGKQAVFVSNREASKQAEALDIDTQLHRAYHNVSSKKGAMALQDKFTPDGLVTTLKYESSFESFEKRDLALIHIDGNGLGLLLIALKKQLKGKSKQQYRQAFRRFSAALETATQTAAKKATAKVLPIVNGGENGLTAMRPIVLGGDDVTLFIKAEAALEFASTFCAEFDRESKLALASLVTDYPNLPKKLSASGAIVYHKVNHPFIQMHHLVEDMCAYAKTLTKSVTSQDKAVGPAVIAQIRVGNASQQHGEALLRQNQYCELPELSNEFPNGLHLGQSRYFVEHDEMFNQTKTQNFYPLQQLLNLSQGSQVTVSMAKWRQMATHIMANDVAEAKRIYNRALALYEKQGDRRGFEAALDALCPPGYQRTDWFFIKPESDGKRAHSFTFINDLLLLEHYQVKQDQPAKRKVQAL
jgi:hypothetical protein